MGGLTRKCQFASQTRQKFHHHASGQIKTSANPSEVGLCEKHKTQYTEERQLLSTYLAQGKYFTDGEVRQLSWHLVRSIGDQVFTSSGEEKPEKSQKLPTKLVPELSSVRNENIALTPLAEWVFSCAFVFPAVSTVAAPTSRRSQAAQALGLSLWHWYLPAAAKKQPFIPQQHCWKDLLSTPVRRSLRKHSIVLQKHKWRHTCFHWFRKHSPGEVPQHQNELLGVSSGEGSSDSCWFSCST